MLRYVNISLVMIALLGMALAVGCGDEEEPSEPQTPETPEAPEEPADDQLPGISDVTEEQVPEAPEPPADEQLPEPPTEQDAQEAADAARQEVEEDADDLAGMLQPLAGKRVAMLLTEGFQDAEAMSPMEYLGGLGAEVTVVGPVVGSVTAYNSDEQIEVETAVADVSVDDFDALVIPGGHSPENLREHEAAVSFAGEFFRSGKPVAAICHGPQVLVTAGVLEGATVTAYSGIEDELTEAGAEYVDEPVVEYENLITSRLPGDLPQFNAAIADALQEQ
ncbi:MAG: type 1 glutamine amidotransferase domain-containing protein [Phycisphaerae bacterium]